jgi:hypothetical protein
MILNHERNHARRQSARPAADGKIKGGKSMIGRADRFRENKEPEQMAEKKKIVSGNIESHRAQATKRGEKSHRHTKPPDQAPRKLKTLGKCLETPT